MKAFAAYRAAYDPNARLHLVGGSSSHLYEVALEQFTHEIGCGDAVRFSGSVDAATLSADYRNADVFVCVSQHEGFCVPLLEAMHFGVPIVALRADRSPRDAGGGRPGRAAQRGSGTDRGGRRIVSSATPSSGAAMIDRGRIAAGRAVDRRARPTLRRRSRAACGARDGRVPPVRAARWSRVRLGSTRSRSSGPCGPSASTARSSPTSSIPGGPTAADRSRSTAPPSRPDPGTG